jgi:hypothetical protein
LAIIKKALYGLRSAGFAWRSYIGGVEKTSKFGSQDVNPSQVIGTQIYLFPIVKYID